MQTHDEMEVCSTVTTKKLSSLAKLILLTIQKVPDASRHKLLTESRPTATRKAWQDPAQVSERRRINFPLPHHVPSLS
ncbi:hypothetical protein F2Q69_00027357 [Brassica cretica]|uniref:Uncharacterized protein n=1 Tax=Brassica cretica TaxID=69181 RepID=A0A8S9S497_BRACR|nr:hypothetical protein F2Q69_00027357 [Brassica cretica]